MGSVAIAGSVARSGFLPVEEMGYMAYGWLKWAFPRRMQAGLINREQGCIQAILEGFGLASKWVRRN